MIKLPLRMAKDELAFEDYAIVDGNGRVIHNTPFKPNNPNDEKLLRSDSESIVKALNSYLLNSGNGHETEGVKWVSIKKETNK